MRMVHRRFLREEPESIREVIARAVAWLRAIDAAKINEKLDDDLGDHTVTELLAPFARGAISPIAMTLQGDYVEWYADAAPSRRLPRLGSESNKARWRKRSTRGYMLDPAFADSLIEIGGSAGEWRMITTELTDKRGDCPIFQSGDDFEGFAFIIGRDVGDWLGVELDRKIRRVMRR